MPINYPCNLYMLLDLYGFKSSDQKDALRFLMKESGIQETDNLLDKKTNNPDELNEVILDFVKLTQRHFTIRTNTEERWDIEASNWMKNTNNHPKILDALTTLDLVDAILPSFKYRDVICILGADKTAMTARLDYAAGLFHQGSLPANILILLAGERYISFNKNGISIDGDLAELGELAASLGKAVNHLTETDLIKAAYETSKLYNQLPAVVIDTPKKDLPRPTTETTVHELCLWLNNHPDVTSITFVSDQPYVEYQKTIISRVLEHEKISIKFEIIGPEYTETAINNTEHKIKELVSALGSLIFVVTPSVLKSL